MPAEGVRPQDDLYRHVNGDWLAQTDIPDDRSMYGSFTILRDTALENCRDLVEECETNSPTHDAELISRLYRTFMDTDAIEERGLADVWPWWRRIDAAHSKRRLAHLLGELEVIGVGGWLGLWIGIDPDDPDAYCPFLTPSGLSLPDEVYYHSDDHVAVRQAFIAHVENMLRLAGDEEAGAHAAAIFALERDWARYHLDSVRSRDIDLTINLSTMADTVAAAPGFAWSEWVKGAGLERMDRVNLTWPSFLAAGARVWSQAPIASLKAWMKWRVLTRFAAYLPACFVEEDFDFYSATLSGTPAQRPRWKRGIDVVESHLGFALGRLYVDRYFPPTAKQAIESYVSYLLKAYEESIAGLEWMGEETRKRALEKLSKFRPKVGYPERARAYDDVAFGEDASLVAMIETCARATHRFEIAKLTRPVDHDEWHMTPQTVNASYSPMANEIVFPAAILQPPFFSVDASDAQNFGGIGAVIGHEIGHGFDDQGSKFDGDGRVHNWWTDTDRAEFEARTSALIAQYDAYVTEGLEEHEHVKGALTIGENIGDLGGLSIALKAWQIRCEDEGTPTPGREEVKEFFVQWATIWRMKIRKPMARQLLVIDPHSPSEVRCNGVVRNMDAFHEAFATTPDDDLWLDAHHRVTIW